MQGVGSSEIRAIPCVFPKLGMPSLLFQQRLQPLCVIQTQPSPTSSCFPGSSSDLKALVTDSYLNLFLKSAPHRDPI